MKERKEKYNKTKEGGKKEGKKMILQKMRKKQARRKESKMQFIIGIYVTEGSDFEWRSVDWKH